MVATADRLQVTRHALGLEPSEFADRAGIPTQIYCSYELARRTLGIDDALKISDAYDLTLEWIFRGNTKTLPFKTRHDLVAGRVAIFAVAAHFLGGRYKVVHRPGKT